MTTTAPIPRLAFQAARHVHTGAPTVAVSVPQSTSSRDTHRHVKNGLNTQAFLLFSAYSSFRSNPPAHLPRPTFRILLLFFLSIFPFCSAYSSPIHPFLVPTLNFNFVLCFRFAFLSCLLHLSVVLLGLFILIFPLSTILHIPTFCLFCQFHCFLFFQYYCPFLLHMTWKS
jgi:hypothetical protein